VQKTIYTSYNVFLRNELPLWWVAMIAPMLKFSVVLIFLIAINSLTR